MDGKPCTLRYLKNNVLVQSINGQLRIDYIASAMASGKLFLQT